MPDTIPPEKLFVAINFFVKSPDNKHITIRLSGCINRSELNIGEIQSPLETVSGSWITHIHTLFPSTKLHPVRKELHHWWREVERLSHVSASQVEADSAKNRFFLYSKSQSSAYRQALEAGLQTPAGQQHLQEYEEFKTKCKQAAFCLSSTVLENLFTEGEVLLLKLLAPAHPAAPHSHPPPPLLPHEKGGGGDVAMVKETLARCKTELHQSFERSLYRLASSLENHEKHAWKNFYDRYTLGKMNDVQATEAAENLLRSTRGGGSTRPRSTPRGGRGRKGKGSESEADRKASGLSTDFSLFSLPSEKFSRRSVRSLSPSRQRSFPRPKTSPSLLRHAPPGGPHKRRPSKTETDFAVHFAQSPFDIISGSLHPEQRRSFHGPGGTKGQHVSPSRQHSQPQWTGDSNGKIGDPSSSLTASAADAVSSLHRTSLSIVQTSQSLILNSVRHRLQCRLELYRKDKTYNFFGTFIHQALWTFQILMFETAVKFQMEKFLTGEYEKMMGSVERVARKDLVALTAVQSKEKVQLLNQGIVSERGMWGRGERGEESPESSLLGTGRALVSDRSEEKPGDHDQEGKGEAQPSAPSVAAASLSCSPKAGYGDHAAGSGESKAQEEPQLTTATPEAGAGSGLNKTLRVLVEEAPTESLMDQQSSPYTPTPPSRYTDLQQKHTAELNELEYRVSEKKKLKLAQFNKVRHQTYQIMAHKLHTIRSNGQAGDLSPTGVILFNNICHVYQLLRGSDKYVDPNANAAGGAMPRAESSGGRRGGETEGREGRFRKLGSRGSGGSRGAEGPRGRISSPVRLRWG
jgi:hypothetical protein